MVKVFIVEDEPHIQFLYKNIINILGYEVVGTASNGQEAIDLYKSFSIQPDLILMDHRMPKKNGIEATKEILKLSNHTKIIFVSADSSIIEEVLSLGVVSFKEKPFTIEKLKRNIEKHIINA
jgi:two-component system chemotaxis response regulator CheY